MKRRRYWLSPFALPTYAQAMVVLLLSFPFWKRPVTAREGMILVTWRPWFAKRWRWSTTLGIIMGTRNPHKVSDRLIFHESIHVNQYIDMNVLGAILGGLVAIADWRWGLGLWLSSGMLWLAPNFLTGWIREGDPYLGSQHEQSAYAQTDKEHPR